MKKTILIVSAILYSSVAAIAYLLNHDELLFYLAVPWSLIVVVLSPVLIHGFGPSAMLNSVAMGCVLNLFVFFRLTLIDSGPADSQ